MKRFRLDVRWLVAVVLLFGPMAVPASSTMLFTQPLPHPSLVNLSPSLSAKGIPSNRFIVSLIRLHNLYFAATVQAKLPPADSALLSA